MRVLLLMLLGMSALAQAEELTFYSKYLKEPRTVTVSPPESYEGSNGDYPTLYVLDGHWYGPLVESTVREANRFVPLLPEFIVVAINNDERFKDFTEETTQPKDRGMYQGPYRADSFRKYLSNELIPKIEEKFRVNSHRLAYGYSLGGGFLAETFHKDADLFSNYILISPYLRWNNDAALRNLGQIASEQQNKKIGIALSIGSDEDNDTRQPVIKLYEELKGSELVSFNDYEGENHTSMPNASLFKSLRTLYSQWFPDRETGTSMNGEQHLEYFKKQHQRYLGTEKIQTNVYDLLFSWFGGDAETLEVLCDSYEASYKTQAQECAKG